MEHRESDTSAQMLMKMKNSNYITYTDEDYEKGLEMLNLPMKMFLDTLEYNPKIVFVKLNHIGENCYSNGSVYKTRNKSVVNFLSPIEVEQKAVQDVKLMCSTIQKMILASGKLITSGIQPVQTVNVTPTSLVNCKTCKATFSKRSDLVNHIDSNHPDIPLQSCTFCGRKFLVLRGLAQHINMTHAVIMMEKKSKDSCESSESFLFNTRSDGEDVNKDHWTYSKYLKDSSKGSAEKEKVNDDSACKYNSKFPSAIFVIGNEGSSSSNSLTNSGNSNDLFKKDKNIDSLSLLSLNSERKSNLDIPVMSVIEENEETENPSEVQVPAILPADQHDVRKTILKPESNDSGKPNENLDFIVSSNTSIKLKTLENAFTGSATLFQDTSLIPSTLKERKIPDFDSITDISIYKSNALLDIGRTSKETSEPKPTVKGNDLTELNSIQNEAGFDNVIVSENQKRLLFTKFGEEEIMPLSSQNDEKTTTKALAADDPQVFSEKICCICLDIINLTRHIFDRQQYSKSKCHECPFCGVRYADIYFEHHVATVHLVCDKEECRSRVILTGSKLRKLLNMQIKMECIHVNCNHNSLTDLKKSKSNSDHAKLIDDQTIKKVDSLKDINVFVNDINASKRQECDATKNNIENYEPEYFSKDLNTCWKNSEDFEREQEKIMLLSNECNASDLKFSIKVEPCHNNIKEEEDCFEENEHVRYTDSLPVDTQSCNMEETKVSSSNGYLYKISSEHSRFDESSKIIKVESSESCFCCCVCKKTFHQEQKLLAHLFNYHRFSYPFTCDICFLCYKHVKDLKTHVQVHGKHMVSGKIMSNTSDTDETVSLQKCYLSDKTTPFEFRVKEEPYYLAKSTEAQHLESEKSNLMKDSSTLERSVLNADTCIDLNVPEELDFLKFNSTQEHASIESNISSLISTINCSPAKVTLKSNDATLHIKNEQKDSPSKKKKLKIPCVVEKVEYPLDIHNLYAHSRKAQDPKVVNSVELELDSNSSTVSNNTNLLPVETKKKKKNPTDCNVSCLKKPNTVRRKMSTSFSVSTKKKKKDDFQAHTDSAATTNEVVFQCKTCEKTFDFKRSYSEHMFFMHDAIFDDSVVYDLLKPSSRESKNIESALQNTGYKINRCTDAEFAQSTKTRVTIEGKDFNRVKVCSMDSASLEKLDKNQTDQVVNNNARNCSQCGERYVQVTSYFQHRYDIHGDDSLVHVCENCSKVLITVNMVNSHLCTQVNTFSCKDCGLKFVNGLALKEHNTATHFESIGPHVCHECKKCFLTNRMLQKHKRIIHSDSGRRSSSCVKKEVKSRLKESDGSRANTIHQVEKVDKNSFVNDDDQNMLRKDLAVNPVKPLLMSKKGRINSLTCPVCKFVLQSIRRLQAHLMVNHSKVTDLCLLCNRLFAFGRGIRHMLDFHIIPVCNKDNEYVLSWEGDPRKDVKEAIEVLGEKRLLAICSYDDYTTMTDSASFQCRHCPMTYSAVRFYRTHYVQRHDDFCALCGQSFESNKDFTLHVENVHNSLKHYLWFTETIISSIIQTEKSKENSLETFIQIIERKLDENEVNAASQLLERMEVERISENFTYPDKYHLVADDTTCKLPGSNSELLEEATIRPSLSQFQIPEEAREVSIVTNEQLPLLASEPHMESYRADILQLPDFCMEYEITDNGTVVTQNSNYCSNEILVRGMKEEKEYTEEGKERKQTINSTTSTRTLEMSNCILENPTRINDGSIVDSKESEIMTVIASCPVATSSQVSSSGHIAEDISLKRGEECSSVAVGINSNANNEKVALVVTEDDLRIYKNNIKALAERLSTTCNELSVDEIVDTLQAYVISQI